MRRLGLSLIFILLLFFAGLTYSATPIYVDPAAADDSGNGETPETAKKTLDAAMNTVEDGGTVICLAGTYDATTQLGGEDWHLEFDSGVNKSVTFEPDTGVDITWTFGTGGTIRALEFYADQGSGKTITFNNLTITCSTGGNTFLVRKMTNNYHNVVFTNCIIDNLLSGWGGLVMASASDVLSDITFTDCTITITAYLFWPTYDLETIKFEGCTIITPNGFQYLNDPKGDVTNLIFKDCIITADDGYYFLDTGDFTTLTSILLKGNTARCGYSFIEWQDPATIRIVERILIEDNNITITAGSPETAIRLGYSWNWISAWLTATGYTAGDIRKNDGEIYECVHNHTSGAGNEPGTGATWKAEWEVARLANVKVIGNTINFLTPGQAHGIYIGFGCDNAEVSYNKVTGGDYQLVIKGRGGNAHHNILYGLTPLYLVSRNGSMVWNNTTYAISGSSSFAIGAQETSYSSKNIVVNNIFAGDGTHSYAANVVDAITGMQNYFNYNCYVGGVSGLVTLGGTPCGDLAAIQARWAAWSIIYSDNDENSIVTNPEFKDAANGDFRLLPTSPCLNRGKRTLSGGYTDMGAWQRISRIRR